MTEKNQFCHNQIQRNNQKILSIKMMMNIVVNDELQRNDVLERIKTMTKMMILSLITKRENLLISMNN